MIDNFIAGETFLEWRKKMILKGGKKVDFDWLLDIGAGVSWSKLQNIILNPEQCFSLEIPTEEIEVIWESHLQDQTPLQHLISKCPWRDFELEVSAEALIPRQETEFLIDFALKKVINFNFGRWADLGTGSGPLAIALAQSLPNWKGHAVDISKDALGLARRNLKSLAPNAKVKFSLGDWWQPLQKWWGSFDLVLSNPPYIPSGDLRNLSHDIINYEPLCALNGGIDGLDLIKKVIYISSKLLKNDGLLIIEIGYKQYLKVSRVLAQFNFREIDKVYDYGDNVRCIISTRV